jgi:hypothetical protein
VSFVIYSGVVHSARRVSGSEACNRDVQESAEQELVVLPEADPFLALDAIRGALLYARDLDAQAEYELYVLRRAGDLGPFARERWERVLRGGG